MLVAARFIPIGQDSTLSVVKMLISVVGFILLCLGALLYLYILIRDRPS
mgnify:CR=1 FL=1